MLRLQAVRLSGRTLTLQLSSIVCPRLRTPTVLRLATPCPIAPTVLSRLTVRIRRPIITLPLAPRKLVSTLLDSLGERTRRKSIVLHPLFSLNTWVPLKWNEDGVTKLPAESFDGVSYP